MSISKNFIPKKVVEQSPQIAAQRTGGISLLGVLAAIFSIGIILSIVTVFLWGQLLSNNLKSMQDSIARAEEIFAPSLILSLQELETKLSSANQIMDEHVALSLLLKSFEETALPSVSFSEFNFSKEDGEYMVSMSGVANDYIVIATQSDIFARNKLVQDHIFSDFRANENGTTSFSFSATVPTSEILYKNQYRTVSSQDNIN